MTAEYPRVLFLTSAAFNRVTGGGLTFGNLFAGWPKDAIATVHNDPVPVTNDVCERYFRLSGAEMRRRGWLRHVRLGQAAVAASATPVPPRSGPAGLAFRAARAGKNLVFGDAIPEEVEISAALDAWIRDFRPQLLYTILGSNAMMEMAERICDRYALPLVIHIMDDWMAVLYRGGLLSPWQRRRKERLMRRLVDRAAARLAISDDMAVAYAERYGRPFAAFHNAIDLARWSGLVKRELEPGKPARVAYIGSILPFAQLDSLIECCDAVDALHREGLPMRLDIYSPGFLAEQHRARLVRPGTVFLHDALSDDQKFFETLRDADVLLLPVNFDPYTVDYIRYSMPTKVPAYLAIGTPILAYGPSEVAQIAYARRAGWALVVSEKGSDALKRGLARIVGDTGLRQALCRRAIATAAERHDAPAVRRDFQAVLRSAGAR